MRAPLFWQDKTFLSTALLPAAWVYGNCAESRQAGVTPHKLPVPVICVGNLVAGGAGKTPVSLALGALLKAQGKKAHYLSRGYKGSLLGPVRVNPALHTAAEVGDEPLLLADILPTWVAKDKIAGAEAAVAAGAEMIVMDDGFQNPHLHKDVSLLVIEGEYGLGNERLIPAGPLREPIASAMQRASAILMLGEDKHNVLRHVLPGKKILWANVEPAPTLSLQDMHVVAFAGIGHPGKFYRTLQQLNCVIKMMVAYPDHHCFTARDVAHLRHSASQHNAQLVTTMKDYVRLPLAMRAEVMPVPIEVVFGDESAVMRIMEI